MRLTKKGGYFEYPPFLASIVGSMKNYKSIWRVGVLLIATLALAGCSPTTVENTSESPAPDNTSTAPEPKPVNSEPVVAKEGFLTPGAVSVNDWQSYEFKNYDDKTAEIAVKVSSIEYAPADFVEKLGAKNAVLAEYSVVLVRYQQKLISGDGIEYNSDYYNFGGGESSTLRVFPVLPLIGFDECTTNYFPKGWSSASEPLDQCVAALIPKGSESAVDSLVYSDNYGAFSSYEGAPAFIKVDSKR